MYAGSPYGEYGGGTVEVDRPLTHNDYNTFLKMSMEIDWVVVTSKNEFINTIKYFYFLTRVPFEITK